MGPRGPLTIKETTYKRMSFILGTIIGSPFRTQVQQMKEVPLVRAFGKSTPLSFVDPLFHLFLLIPGFADSRLGPSSELPELRVSGFRSRSSRSSWTGSGASVARAPKVGAPGPSDWGVEGAALEGFHKRRAPRAALLFIYIYIYIYCFFSFRGRAEFFPR